MKIRLTLLILLLFSINYSLFAGENEISVRLDKAYIVTGAQLIATDLTHDDEVTSPTLYKASRRTKIELINTRDLGTDVTTAKYWHYEVDYEMVGTTGSGTLIISSNITEGTFNHLAILDNDEDIAHINVTAVRAYTSTSPITSLFLLTPLTNPESSADIPADIKLVVTVETERFEFLDPDNKVKLYNNGYVANEGIDIGWGHIAGAEAYDLEWVFIDANDDFPTPTTLAGPFEEKEGTRVTVSSNTYMVDPMFPEGIVYFRVRPLGVVINDVGTDYTHTKIGPWSYETTISSGTAVKQSITTSFEDNKNWQYVISFAEEGKSKKVVSYMDGSLKGRQSVTKLSTEDVFVASVNRYDYEGRETVSILPSAIDRDGADHNYSYKELLNKNSGGTAIFDKKEFDKGSYNTIGTANGTGLYYSSSNPFTDAINIDYVPDAEGYPYAQTEFMRDGTGRIKRTSGIGADHKLGSGHASYYYYSKPNSTELIRMFGNDVGNVNHYKKNYVIDPNGQMSATYLDQEGRTIATCLVGEAPGNLDELPGAADATLTVSLNDDNYFPYEGDIVSMVEASIFNDINQIKTYSFDYDMTTGGVNSDSPFSSTNCQNCSYTLEIKILYPDGSLFDLDYNGNPTVTESYSNSVNSCPSSTYIPTAAPIEFDFTTAVSDPVGEYKIIKTLYLDTDAIETLMADIISTGTMTGLPDLAAIQAQMLGEIDYSNCEITCDQQAGAEGSGPCNDSFTDELPSNMIDQCTELLEGLKDDVSPNGWLFESPWLELQLPMTGIPAAGSLYTTRTEVEDNWDVSFADLLVVEHREYCHWEKCDDLTGLGEYPIELAMIADWDEATTGGYTDPTGTGTPHDPIMDAATVTNTDITSTQQDDLDTKITIEYYWDGAAWETLIEAVTPGSQMDTDFDFYNGITSGSQAEKERKWQLFTSFYLAERTDVIETAYSGCPYYSDDHSIMVDANSQVGVPGGGLALMESQCIDACAMNVENWMYIITEECTALTTGNKDDITAYLESYCGANCDGTNPAALIIEDDITTNSDLIAIKNILNAASCDGPAILDSLGKPDPCSGSETITITVSEFLLTTEAETWENFINELLSISGFALNTPYDIDISNFPSTYNDIVNYDYLHNGTLEANKVEVTNENEIEFYYNSTLITSNVQFMCLYDGNFNFTPLTDVNLVSGVTPNSYTDGNDYTIKFVAELNTTVPDIDVYSPGGCPNYYGNEFSHVFYEKSSVYASSNSVDVETCTTWVSTSDFDFTFDPDSYQDECEAMLELMANAAADLEYQTQLDAWIDGFYDSFVMGCTDGLVEDFYYSYTNREHQYTLFYYDQAGNLIQTVPPAGVNLVATTNFSANGTWNSTVPVHELKTTYKYNALNQLISQHTPDAGDATFYYNDVQQLRYSQNDEQANNDYYSYTRYDEHGRVIEAGQTTLTVPPTSTDLNDASKPSTNLAQVTNSYYDENPNTITGFTPENLRGRIAAVTNDYDNDQTDYDHGTHYSYDIHGNVQELVQENRSILFPEQQVKKMSYDYDLISGNVNEVIYQEGELDEYRHRYEYDADNRLKVAYTSKEGEIWTRAAKYFYYLHGPLARVEIGHDKVAANDFAYTIQGWLKGVNSATLVASRDIGGDGNNVTTNLNKKIARDAMGFTLGYFDGDYSSIGTSSFLATGTTAIAPTVDDLYNGNISHMTTGMLKTDESLANIHGNAYRYDQLNRIKRMDVFTNQSTLASSNSWTGATEANVLNNMGDYHTDYTYDQNGNLQSTTRKAYYSTSSHDMDEIDYVYGTGDLQNRLTGTLDTEEHPLGTLGDIKKDPLGTYNIYSYNDIGQLTDDVDENISGIEWTVNGKVKKIARSGTGTEAQVEFNYDAMGNRISKIEKPRVAGVLQGELDWIYTFYVLDASGNTMSTYKMEYNPHGPKYRGDFTLTDVPLYGSSRVGIHQIDKYIYRASFVDANYTTNQYFSEISNIAPVFPSTEDDLDHNRRVVGNKHYEQANHLGNVLAIVSDVKLGVENGSTGIVDYYTADVQSYSDYYPFGMLMPGRHASTPDYRYGFQGQEKDDEISGTGNSYTAQFWQYDSRLGRRWNVDPEVKFHESPYATFANNPILFIDPSGADTVRFQKNYFYSGKDAQSGGDVYSTPNKGGWGVSLAQAKGKDVFYYDEIWHNEDGSTRTNSKQFDPIEDTKTGVTETSAPFGLFSSKDRGRLTLAKLASPQLLDYLKNKSNGMTRLAYRGAIALKADYALYGGLRTIEEIAYSFGGFSLGMKSISSLGTLSITKTSLSSLSPTHFITRSKTAMNVLVKDIRANGITTTIKVVTHDGIKYIVNGNHRYYIAKKLGIKNVPIEEISLPYRGYKTIDDLLMPMGKQPGYWKYMK